MSCGRNHQLREMVDGFVHASFGCMQKKARHKVGLYKKGLQSVSVPAERTTSLIFDHSSLKEVLFLTEVHDF